MLPHQEETRRHQEGERLSHQVIGKNIAYKDVYNFILYILYF